MISLWSQGSRKALAREILGMVVLSMLLIAGLATANLFEIESNDSELNVTCDNAVKYSDALRLINFEPEPRVFLNENYSSCSFAHGLVSDGFDWLAGFVGRDGFRF